MKLLVRIVLCIAAALPAQSLFACGWCDKEAPLTVLSLLKEDARYDATRSALLAGGVVSKEYQPIPLFLSHQFFDSTPPLDDRFYTDYLSVYFPKADVITQLLAPTMCADAIARALRSIIFLVTYAPWRYFVNDPKGFMFEPVHVSILEKQLRQIIYGVRLARIDRKTHCVIAARDLSAMRLLDYWDRQGEKESFYITVAFYIDTIVHQLYNAIKNENYSEASQRNDLLQDSVDLLVGSRFEQHYTLSARLFADLVKLLHERLWGAVDHRDDNAVLARSALALIEQPLELRETNNLRAQHFLDSFVTHYEVNVTGKFTHEYHPIILEETARSFAQLERELTASKLPIIGRLTLMGYEEQGAARYKTRYTDAYFSDEMAQRTQAGWSLKMFNRFGLLTGFLCKDVAALKHELKGDLPVTHINPDQIEIFDGIGTLFQEHAFGEAFKPTMRAYQRAQECLLRKSLPDFFIECMRFWHALYSQELKVAGKQHVVGTQDILFSIAYMRYVRNSTVPIRHFYVGPDITYPIETSLLHNKEATRHAQTFVKTFIPQLKPIEGKKTAYVFCSFVDGVGKSTMLGNVQNAMKHGDKIEEYEHVDNSSSQLATVFDYSSDVVIADLPAQVSHFTYKPDGFVYVDCGALRTQEELAALQVYVKKNHQKLVHDFGSLLARAKEYKKYDLVESEKENPELSFALNLHLLDKAATNEWISFRFKEEYYLFNSRQPDHIRQRVALATAPSHGLKNCCPEQMIFSVGVRFPLAYDDFLSDLIKQLKEHGTEQIIMVDFVSMYSRSSRENIRVNYVIQQLALLNKKFLLSNSFYQDFVHNAQLLALLDAPGKEQQFIKTLEQESLLRLALFDMLFDRSIKNIDGIDLESLTTQLRDRISQYDPSVVSYASQSVAYKVRSEHDRLFQAYGQTREYVTLQQWNPADLLEWSKALYDIMTREIDCEPLQELWQKCPVDSMVLAETLSKPGDDGIRTAVLDSGQLVEVVGRIDKECKDRQLLLSLVRMARARWYAACSNLLYTHKQGDFFELLREKVPVIPLVVVPDNEGKLCFVQPQLPKPVTLDGVELPNYSLFGIEKQADEPAQWRVYDNRFYLHDWSTVAYSHGGVFAYGHELSSEPIENQKPRSAIVSNLYTKFAQTYGADKVLVPAFLSEMMKEKKQALKNNYERWAKESAKNGAMPHDAPLPRGGRKSKKELESVKVYALQPSQRPGVCLFIRLVATLDMCVKDLDSDFALRRNNSEDFVAHVALLEKITVPWLFCLFSPDKLFDVYEQVTPVCMFE